MCRHRSSHLVISTDDGNLYECDDCPYVWFMPHEQPPASYEAFEAENQWDPATTPHLSLFDKFFRQLEKNERRRRG